MDKFQVDLNKKMAMRGGGLIAPVHGGERVYLVHHNHMVAFCKAAKLGCRTNHRFVMDITTGKIDIAFLESKGFGPLLN